MGYVLFGLLCVLLLVLRYVARRAPPPPEFPPAAVPEALFRLPQPYIPPPVAPPKAEAPPRDYLDQHMEDVSRPDVTFSTSRVMNGGEWKVFRAAMNVIGQRAPAGVRPFYAFPQVALGQVIHTEDEDAYRAINSKRCDLLIADRYGKPVAVVEYQGAGHNLSAGATKRDKIKRVALEKAGVQFVEIQDGASSYQIESTIREILTSKTECHGARSRQGTRADARAASGFIP